MKVPEMTVRGPGTLAYHRVPPRTFGYPPEILLMRRLPECRQGGSGIRGYSSHQIIARDCRGLPVVRPQLLPTSVEVESLTLHFPDASKMAHKRVPRLPHSSISCCGLPWGGTS